MESPRLVSPQLVSPSAMSYHEQVKLHLASESYARKVQSSKQ